jgi:hypothetical protein
VTPTAEQLAEHVRYEVIMLSETRRKLNERDANDQIAVNALMESFCIHARNLNEFFLETGRYDTLKASAFSTQNYARPVETAIRQAIFSKINKQISHLTEARTTVPQQKIGHWRESRCTACFLMI